MPYHHFVSVMKPTKHSLPVCTQLMHTLIDETKDKKSKISFQNKYPYIHAHIKFQHLQQLLHLQKTCL